MKEGPAMTTWTRVTALAFALTLAATPVIAQPRAYVEEMQKALRAQGHDPGEIDGRIGPQTVSAIKAYQRQQGLEPTGYPDEATLTKLGESTTAANTTATAPVNEPRDSPSASPQTGGDTQPSSVEPAKGTP
jgi:peptidoglycan hydrolase-like protein with peptidoglycan-binding domain